MHIISISSLKGGVGKTTVTLGLASASFSCGLRTLVVDFDPQADVSTALDVKQLSKLNVSDVLDHPKKIEGAIVQSGWNEYHEGTVDLLLGSPAGVHHDKPFPSKREVFRLEEALSYVENKYDIVLIDCPPSLNALTRTAWVASDKVLIVTEPSIFAVAAADRALKAIDELRRGVTSRLQPGGIVINRARESSVEHQFRTRELRELFGSMVLDPVFYEMPSIQQVQGAAKPLHLWPDSTVQKVAQDYDQLLTFFLRAFQMKPPYPPSHFHS